jgi:spore germination protein
VQEIFTRFSIVSFDNIDFTALSQYLYAILILSYDWGYSFDPPASAIPINITEQMLKDLSIKIPIGIISLGFPVIGYDWKPPYVPGETKAFRLLIARSVSRNCIR